MEEVGINIKDMLSQLMPGGRTRRRRLKVSEARRLVTQEEAQKLVDADEAVAQGIQRVENSGIIFLDELDKIAGREGGRGPDVSREGVQRDLLPIVEGSDGHAPSTGWCGRTTCSSSPPARSTSPSPPT